MKKTLLLAVLFCAASGLIAQADTLSNNIYQLDGKLGIGTSEPHTWLSVVNDTNIIGHALFTNIAGFRRIYEESAVQLSIYGYPDTDLLPEYHRSSVMIYATDGAKNLKLTAAPRGGSIQFSTSGWYDTSTERMRIDSIGQVGIGTIKPNYRLDVVGDINFTGNLLRNGEAYNLMGPESPWTLTESGACYFMEDVGIGTQTPEAKLQVADGDIYISQIEKGIIMRSPDGGCWRGVLDNSGNIHFSPVTCPGENETLSSIAEPKGAITLFPNPSNGMIAIDMGDLTVRKQSYELLGLNGQSMLSGQVKNSIQEIDVSSLSAGVYLLAISDRKGSRIATRQVVIN